MWHLKSIFRIGFGIGACLVLGGCFQGYGQDVSSQAELDALLLSLTPGRNTQPLVTPVIQSTTLSVTDQPTRVPTIAPATPTTAPIIVDGGTIIHIVAEGDTLFGIAQQYNVSVELLSALNAITDPNSLFVEQALIIPPTNAPQVPTEVSTQTSNLPTETATSLPTNTATATLTVTSSPTPSLTPSSTTIPHTTVPSWTPSSTAVILSTQTPQTTLEERLDASAQTVHIVQTGQTLFQISRSYNIPLDVLTDANQIDDPSQVTIGQELLIPVDGVSSTESEETLLIIPTETLATDTENELPSESVHVVSAGETLYQISLVYGIGLDALARENNIADTSQVLVGQTLRIPDATPIAILESSSTSLETSTTSTIPQRIALDIPAQINGVLLSQFVNINADTEANILSIYQQGQELGRNPRAFSKLGDSTIENPHFLTRFDNWQGFEYYLGDYIYLEAVIDYYAGSFIRQGAAVRRGMHSWTVFDPQWADKSLCRSNESALTCEFRIHNPSILLVRLGANDVGVPQAFENNLRDVIEYSIENGVIPVLGTKADRNDGASNANNLIIRRLAEEYQVPLWDFDILADTLPRRGLTTDGVHMTINFSHDYTDPNTFRTGHGVHNLSALIMLDILWLILSPDIG